MPLNKNAADAVSRIPYHLAAAAIICLMRPEPGTCNVASNGSSPIWSCCGRSLPCDGTFITTRWALTPPFHPYRLKNNRRSALCCTGLTAEYSLQHPSFQRGSLLCAVRTFLNTKKFFMPRLPMSTAFHYNINTFLQLCKRKKCFFQDFNQIRTT